MTQTSAKSRRAARQAGRLRASFRVGMITLTGRVALLIVLSTWDACSSTDMAQSWLTDTAHTNAGEHKVTTGATTRLYPPGNSSTPDVHHRTSKYPQVAHVEFCTEFVRHQTLGLPATSAQTEA